MSLYISIIIPLYNGIEFLENAINSIRSQTYKYWNLIVGINGHTIDSDVYKKARSFELLQNEFGNIYINLYDTKGKENTCNRIIKDCQHDIICLLDVDDYWEPTKLEKQITIWKQNKYDIIGTHCNYFGDIIGSPSIPSGEITPSTIFKSNPIINSSIMIKKNDAHWINRYNLDDYDMWMRLTFEGKRFYNIPEKLTWHRIHKSSAFNNTNNNMLPKLMMYWQFKMNDLSTIVTCYYNIKSKFPSSQYIEWMDKFLSLQRNMIIFTDEQSESIIKNIRIKYKLGARTHIIIKKLEDWETYKYYDYWKYCHSIDIEKSYHTPELYMLWNEKTYFVKQSIETNPFKSYWFFWTDIGCIRNNYMLNFVKNYPNPYKIIDLPTDKIVLITINSFTQNDYKLDNNIPIIFMNQNENTCCKSINRIQGGFFGGHINSWQMWINLYDEYLNKFINNKIFAGKDQYVMSSIYINNIDKINLINAKNTYGDPWFYFLYHFN